MNQIEKYHFWQDGERFVISTDSTLACYASISEADSFENVSLFYPTDPSRGCPELAYLIMQAFKYRAVTGGAAMFHAAAVEYNGSAVLFCGMPGAGKSTQAELWIKHLGARPFNYDQPCVTLNGGEIRANGTPWSGKESLYLNESHPLRAIVFVEQAPFNKAELLSPAEGFSLIYLNNYILPLTTEFENAYFSVISRIVEKTPIIRLKCTIDRQAVEAVKELIF